MPITPFFLPPLRAQWGTHTNIAAWTTQALVRTPACPSARPSVVRPLPAPAHCRGAEQSRLSLPLPLCPVSLSPSLPHSSCTTTTNPPPPPPTPSYGLLSSPHGSCSKAESGRPSVRVRSSPLPSATAGLGSGVVMDRYVPNNGKIGVFMCMSPKR